MTDIRELDGYDPATNALLLPVIAAMTAAEMDATPEPTPEFLHLMLTPPARHEATVFAGFDAAGDPWVFARVYRDPDHNPTVATTLPWADPARREPAAESAFLAAVAGWARSRGCDRLILDAPLTPALVALAERDGGRIYGSNHRSVLELATVSRERFAALAAPTPANEDYRIEQWSGLTPEALLPAFTAAGNAINDAPQGDVEIDPAMMTVEQVRAREAGAAARGLTQHVTAALAPDGEIAAFAQLYTFAGRYGQANIGSTVAVAAHRGRRLGVRVKAAQTLWALDNLPWLSIVETWNHADNAPMLKVNAELGYRLAGEWGQVEFTL